MLTKTIVTKNFRGLKKSMFLMVATAGVVAFSNSAAHAAFMYWDGTPDTSGLSGGSGPWNTGNGNANRMWKSASDGTGSKASWTNNNDAFFNASGGGTATVSGTVQVNSITFNETGYIVAGAALTLTGSATVTTNADATITAPLTGSAGILKNGSGSLWLQTATTHTGTVEVSQGKLLLAQTLSGASDIRTFINGQAVKLSGGTLELGGSSSTNVTLNASSWTVTADSELVINRTATGSPTSISADFNDTLSIGAKLKINFGGNVPTSGPTAVGLSNMIVTYGATTLTNNATFEVGGTQGTQEFNLRLGAIGDGAGSYGITKTGGGNLRLDGASTYDGATTISAGTLALGVNSGISTASSVSVASGAFLALNNFTQTIAGLTGSGTVQNGGSASKALTVNKASGSDTFSGTLVNGGTGALEFVKSGAGTLILDGTLSNTGGIRVTNGTLTVNSAYTAAPVYVGSNYTNSPVLNGSGNLVGVSFQGAGTLAMASGVNIGGVSGSGAVNPNSQVISPAGSGVGTLTINSGGSTSLVPATLTGNGRLLFDINGAMSDLLAITGGFEVTGAPSIGLTTAGTLSGNYTLATFSSAYSSGSPTTFNNSTFTLPTAPTGYAWLVNSTSIQLVLENNSALTGAAITDLRVMQGSSTKPGVAVISNSSATSTGAYTLANGGGTDAVVIAPNTGTAPVSGSDNAGLVGWSVTGSTGARTGKINITNTSNAGDAINSTTQDITVTGAVVAQRSVSAAPVSLGRQMLGANLGVVNSSTAFSTTGADANFTRITVNGQLFNSTMSPVLAVSGTVSSVAASGTLASYGVTGEGLAGEGSYSNVAVGYTATAVGNRVVTAGNVNFGNVLKGATVSATTLLQSPGADSANTRVYVGNAGADVNGIAVTGGTLVNSGNRFNGSNSDLRTVAGTLGAYGTIAGQTITLTTTGEGLSGESAVDVSFTYSANVGMATAKVDADDMTFDAGNALSAGAGSAIAGLESQTTAGGSVVGTTAKILEADAASIATGQTIGMNWRDRTTAETTLGNAIFDASGLAVKLGSDVVDLTGVISSGATKYTLQMTYDDAGMTNEETAAEQGFVFLAYFNGTKWVNAGNLGLFATADQDGYDVGTDFVLGKWGVDTTNNLVWAVVDHNSQFAAAVPEPASLGVLMLGGLALMGRRRK